MKKEVTVCDAIACRSLADVVCSICDRDMCNSHGKFRVVAVMTIEANDTSADRTIVNMRRDFVTPCCYLCATDAQPVLAITGVSADTVLQPFSAQIIEYLRACFAAAKIKKGS